MATDRGISTALAVLHECFPTREIGATTLDVWARVFADWDDDELDACVLAVTREPGRTFFPTPGEIAAHRHVTPVDTDAVLERVSKLGTYNPHIGWIYPRPDEVRAALGDALGDAYAAAGGGLALFADAPADGKNITRETARRVFLAELTTQRKRGVTPIAPPSAPALGDGGKGLALVGDTVAGVVAALSRGKADGRP